MRRRRRKKRRRRRRRTDDRLDPLEAELSFDELEEEEVHMADEHDVLLRKDQAQKPTKQRLGHTTAHTHTRTADQRGYLGQDKVVDVVLGGVEALVERAQDLLPLRRVHVERPQELVRTEKPRRPHPLLCLEYSQKRERERECVCVRLCLEYMPVLCCLCAEDTCTLSRSSLMVELRMPSLVFAKKSSIPIAGFSMMPALVKTHTYREERKKERYP